jgi:folate-dependent phosphoribosylglycinamide formyltransferase PurN
MNPESPRVMILACCGAPQYALVNAIAQRFPVSGVVLERRGPVLAGIFLRRLKKLGFPTILNQLLFKALDFVLFRPGTIARAEEILDQEIKLPDDLLPESRVLKTNAINSPEVLDFVIRTRPDAVVVSGVSVIGAPLLEAFGRIPVMNIHCGITPRYRGNHGAFWAVANNDWENVGTTVHLIDEGLDTGAILAQSTIELESSDTPRTLALKQHAVGIRMAVDLLSRVGSSIPDPIERPDLDSRFYSSPTFTAYLAFRRNLKNRTANTTN